MELKNIMREVRANHNCAVMDNEFELAIKLL